MQARCAAEKHQAAERAYKSHLQQVHDKHEAYKQEAQEATAELAAQSHALQATVADLGESRLKRGATHHVHPHGALSSLCFA